MWSERDREQRQRPHVRVSQVRASPLADAFFHVRTTLLLQCASTLGNSTQAHHSPMRRPHHSEVSSTHRNSTAARFEPVDLTTQHLDRTYVSQHSSLTRPGPGQPIAAHVSQFAEDSAELGR